MEIISGASESVLTILKRFKSKEPCARLLHYCVQTPVEEGMLLLNTLTREMVLLSEEESKNPMQLQELSDRWFFVPEETKEKEYADLVKWVLATRQKKTNAITSYTIFPTTDCNARCFYCFELGRSRIPMSQETAEKVAQYIASHCGDKPVKLMWFGGEPLYNRPAIDTICNGLRQLGVEFKSTMVSNGYLFDEEIVRAAVDDWNLKNVQITLDGTEAVYNKAKAYIYRDGSPYQIVLNNIGRLLDAKVRVIVRCNMDLYNADDLLNLVEELAQRFVNKNGLYVYAHHIFDGKIPMAQMHTSEEWEKRDQAMRLLEEKIEQHGLMAHGGISKNIKMNHCMADSGRSVTILPDGNVGLCEHFSESEFIGHIDREGFDQSAVADWKATTPQIPECEHCFYYLDCVILKKCPNSSECYPQYRQERYRRLQRQMVNTYKKWKNQVNSEEEDDAIDC